MKGFIKLYRSPELLEVLEHYPKAFVLLTVIAVRARRDGDRINPHALELGEALMGDSKAAGLSRQEYRTALAQLVEMGIVTTRATNKGTIVKLAGSEFYDINAGIEQPTEKPAPQPPKQPIEVAASSQQPAPPATDKATTKKKSEAKEAKNEEEQFINFVVGYLNEKTGKDFRANTKETAAMIRARMAEGHGKENFMRVVDTKVAKWGNDPKMADYLRPTTLFRPTNFEAYLNEKPAGEAVITDLAALNKLKDENPSAYSEMISKIIGMGYRPAYKKGAMDKKILAGYVDTKNANLVTKMANSGYAAEVDAVGNIVNFMQK